MSKKSQVASRKAQADAQAAIKKVQYTQFLLGQAVTAACEILREQHGFDDAQVQEFAKQMIRRTQANMDRYKETPAHD